MRKFCLLMLFALTFFVLPGQGMAANFTPECLDRGAMWSNVLVDYEINTTGMYGDPGNALGRGHLLGYTKQSGLEHRDAGVIQFCR